MVRLYQIRLYETKQIGMFTKLGVIKASTLLNYI